LKRVDEATGTDTIFFKHVLFARVQQHGSGVGLQAQTGVARFLAARQSKTVKMYQNDHKRNVMAIKYKKWD
jgi:hypothetical protein